MPSKNYLNYEPLIEEEKVEEQEKDMTGYVTTNIFRLMFGFDYPKAYQKHRHVETIRYPKTDGSNGKVSRFR
jgi:hypothetical protein|tara:strand:+ start:1458 stop:1673 length:216 start_codon:yes stop_codon:yes gene_type:complete